MTTDPIEPTEAMLRRRIAELEAERDRYRDALEAIADDVEEWEMKLVAMQALKEIDND